MKLKELKMNAKKQARGSDKHSTGKVSNLVDNLDDSMQDLIATHARKFCVMNEVFVSSAAFLVPRSQGVRSDDKDRWQTDESALDGLVAELYEEMPLSLHRLMKGHSSFQRTV